MFLSNALVVAWPREILLDQGVAIACCALPSPGDRGTSFGRNIGQILKIEGKILDARKVQEKFSLTKSNMNYFLEEFQESLLPSFVNLLNFKITKTQNTKIKGKWCTLTKFEISDGSWGKKYGWKKKFINALYTGE